MLSNGISSRLQRLQSAKKCSTCHERPSQKPSAGTTSMGHGLQTAAHTIVVPARNGLAADLIKKFNQMSVAGCDRPATIGRSVVSYRHPLNTSTHQSPHMSAASDDDDDDESDHESDGGDSHAAAPESADDAASLDYDDDSHSCASIASDSSTAVGGESHTTFQEAESEASASKGTSPFLSDSELNRALLEIREFGRNMNISLLDDEM
ncbi:hypothetical protein GGI17_003394 [Coemansia sp. S146]|nr:hypothetical protein GGI17_003394 [Coemansia sp. S146]